MSTPKQYVQADESRDSDSERLRLMFRRVKEEYEKLKKAYLDLKAKTDAESTENKRCIAQLTEDLDQLRTQLDLFHSSDKETTEKLQLWSKWFTSAYEPSVSEISSRISAIKHNWMSTLNTTQKIADLTSTIYEWRSSGAPPRIISAASVKVDRKREEKSGLQKLQRILIDRYGTVERGWWEFLNSQRKPKISSTEFFKKARELGYTGDIRKLWDQIAVGNFLTLERLSMPGNTAVKNFRAALAKLGNGSVGAGWQLYFESESGIMGHHEFETKMQKMLTHLDTRGIFSSLAPDGLLTLEDVDEGSFRFAVGRPEIADAAEFIENLNVRYGSLGRAWLWLFEGKAVKNFTTFARAVRAAGYTGPVKRLWRAIGGGVSLEIFDPKISRVHTKLRGTVTVENFWFRGNFVMNQDEFVSKCQSVSDAFTFEELTAAFAFLDYEDCGFVTVEDLEPDAVEKLPDTTVEQYAECKARFNRAYKAKKTEGPGTDGLAKKGEFKEFTKFLAGVLGNAIRVWIQAVGSPTETLDFAGFLGVVRGLGWKGRVKSFWIYDYQLKRDDRIDVAKLSGSSQGELIRRFYESVIIKHDTVSRAWRLVINAHETGYVTRDKFARLCARGDVAEPFTEAEGKVIFDILDFTGGGQLRIEDFDPFGSQPTRTSD